MRFCMIRALVWCAPSFFPRMTGAARVSTAKLVFQEQRAHSFDVWEEPMVTLRLPKLFDLRGDPFERADHDGIDYPHWRLERVFLLVPAQAYVGQFLQTFREYPPRQRPGSFNLDRVMQSLQNPNQGNQ